MGHTIRTSLASRRPISLALLLALLPIASPPRAAFAMAAKQPPPQRILLESLGFQGISTRYLLSGATMLTLDYVDNQHLLVTFGVPRLMRRLPGDPPEDEDRVVDAVLLELPSGRELARTEWRFHDVGQYLWNLGNGRFLLRQRTTLTTFAPLAQLAAGKSFEQSPLLHFDRRIDSILLSADHQLLTVETSDPNQPAQELAAIPPPQTQPQPQPQYLPQPVPGAPGLVRRPVVTAAPPPPPPAAVQVEQRSSDIQVVFIRLLGVDSPTSPIVASRAGGLHVDKDVAIPMTSEGYLRAHDPNRISVQFEFNTFAGKATDLGPFETSCLPSPTFVSPSEFIAFGCRGSDDQLTLAGFNLRGDLMWQTNLNDLQAFPAIVSSIPAGRFALSRTVTLSHIFPGEIPSTSQIAFQEVRVLQMYNGKQLLRVFTSPVQRAGQNFALSPDGMALAVIHDPVDPRAPVDERQPSIEIYQLPPLSPADQQQVKAEAALAPPPSTGPVRFATTEVKTVVAAAKSGATSEPETSPQAGQVPDSTAIPHTADGSDPSAPSALRPTYGDIPPPPNRKPPTLYTEPGEEPPSSATKPDPEAPPPLTSTPDQQSAPRKPNPPNPN